MVEYKCKKCNKTFSHYGNYKTHQMRIFPCDGIKSTKNIHSSPKPNSTETVEPPKKQSEYKPPNKPPVPPIKINEEELTCKYCSKKFSRKDVCKRHEKNSCKEKKNQQNTTIINNYQTVNNYQQNIQNNLQQNFNAFSSNIPINPFGKEDISFLTNELMKNILKNPDYGIPRLIRLIHFNPSVPQNHNVRLKNKKEPYLNVFNGQNWELRDKDDTIQDLITSKKELADDFFENLLTQQDSEITKKQDKIIDALQQKKYETYTEAIDEYLNTIVLDNDSSKHIIVNKYKRLYDKLYKQINLILINNTQLANHIRGHITDETFDEDTF